jgi:hypothetical protein
MGGRGSHSSSFSAHKRPATLESLGLKETEDFSALPDSTKTIVLESVDRMYKELPKLKGEIAYLDFYKRPKRKINWNNMGDVAHAKPYYGNTNITLLESFINIEGLNKRLADNESGTRHQNAKSVIYHEIGHAAVNRIRRNTGNPSIETTIVNKATSHGKVSDISRYATTSHDETIGEAVGDYMTNGSKASPVSISIWKQLKSYLS